MWSGACPPPNIKKIRCFGVGLEKYEKHGPPLSCPEAIGSLHILQRESLLHPFPSCPEKKLKPFVPILPRASFPLSWQPLPFCPSYSLVQPNTHTHTQAEAFVLPSSNSPPLPTTSAGVLLDACFWITHMMWHDVEIAKEKSKQENKHKPTQMHCKDKDSKSS